MSFEFTNTIILRYYRPETRDFTYKLVVVGEGLVPYTSLFLAVSAAEEMHLRLRRSGKIIVRTIYPKEEKIK